MIKTISRLFQSIACLWLAVGFALPLHGGVIINSYIFTTAAGVATSYANPGGSGSRTAIIAVSQSSSNRPDGNSFNLLYLVNGANTNVNYFPNSCPDGEWVKFDFGSGKVITALKFIQQSVTSQGTWQLEGSNDDSSWSSVGSTFTLGSPEEASSAFSSNSTYYRYYRLKKTGGSTNGSVCGEGQDVARLVIRIHLLKEDATEETIRVLAQVRGRVCAPSIGDSNGGCRPGLLGPTWVLGHASMRTDPCR